MDALLAAEPGSYLFDAEALVADAVMRWPTLRFERARGRTREVTDGQLALPSDDGGHSLLVDLLRGGTGMHLERDRETAARFLAWLTAREGFPERSVVLFGWGSEPIPMHPAMTAEALLAHPSAAPG